jgi:hypothetical protein
LKIRVKTGHKAKPAEIGHRPRKLTIPDARVQPLMYLKAVEFFDDRRTLFWTLG